MSSEVKSRAGSPKENTHSATVDDSSTTFEASASGIEIVATDLQNVPTRVAYQEQGALETQDVPRKGSFESEESITRQVSTVTKAVNEKMTRMVSWTAAHTKTSTSARGLRPLHVRISVRVHHVSFLHPGLDTGGRTLGDKGQKWRFRKKKLSASDRPGLLEFGKNKGTWRNPNVAKKKLPFGHTSTKQKPFDDVGRHTGKIPENRVRFLNTAAEDLERFGQSAEKKDATEISEIISAEAFRLSRDGMIQNHNALKSAARMAAVEKATDAMSTNRRMSLAAVGTTVMMTNRAAKRSSRRLSAQSEDYGDVIPKPKANILSPYSSSNPDEAAQYYKECAERPKGYRRLVVSSMKPASDIPIPPPPVSSMGAIANTKKIARNLHSSSGGGNAGLADGSTNSSGYMSTNETAWSFQSSNDLNVATKDENNNSFEDVPYQYVGPPQTGPDFFTLLRQTGAATFGRYLPEISANVPDHSVAFEVHRSRKRRASTQPLVIEAPHVIWGDARDPTLSRIADEGCPLIDSRGFEYVSNANLGDSELSESLLVCGATLWVQNADEGNSAKSKLKPNYTKNMVKAEYFGGKAVDGVKSGMTLGAQGMAKGVKGVARGTKEAVRKTEKLLPIPDDKAFETASMASEGGGTTEKKKKKSLLKKLNPKNIGKKMKRKAKKVDGESISTADNDDMSSLASGAEQHTDTMRQIDADFATEQATSSNSAETHIPDDSSKASVKSAASATISPEFDLIKPKPYTLLLDDTIEIKIVSFPDKQVIASFPISVASIMVQRSVEDQMDDPMKPSELTATLIQEPSAHELNWGVALKVTLRAVEVQPEVPRVAPRPKDIVESEMRKFKENLNKLGKTKQQIAEETKAREEALEQEDSELNGAIVSYGMGKGEYEGLPQREIRLRQMFYCDREHQSLKRKIKQSRRTELTESAKVMILDAEIDPSVVRMTKKQKSERALKELLDLNFPGIDHAEEENVEGKWSSSKFDSPNENTLARVSLALAKSLDTCLGDVTDKPTVPDVERQMRRTYTEGMGANLTPKDIKAWCSDVAQRLSTLSDQGERPPLDKIQSFITNSVGSLRVPPSLDEQDDQEPNIDEVATRKVVPVCTLSSLDGQHSRTSLGSQESKVAEDEIAQREEAMQANDSIIVDWCTAVSSKLDAFAQDLDDDEGTVSDINDDDHDISGVIISSQPDAGVGLSSLIKNASSVTKNSSILKNAASVTKNVVPSRDASGTYQRFTSVTDTVTGGATKVLKTTTKVGGSLSSKVQDAAEASALSISHASKDAVSIAKQVSASAKTAAEQATRVSISDRIPGMKRKPKDDHGELELKDILKSRKSTGSNRQSEHDDLMWKKVLPSNDMDKPISKRALSESAERLQRASTVCTIEEALPRSKSTPSDLMRQLDSVMNETQRNAHSTVHTKTSVLNTVMYLAFVAVALLAASEILYRCSQRALVASYKVFSMLNDLEGPKFTK